MAPRIGRRQFVVGAGAASLGLLAGCGSRGASSGSVPADAPPETRTLRLADTGTLCHSPLYVAQELLEAEGFQRVEYVRAEGRRPDALTAAGAVDLSTGYAPNLLTQIDAGEPIVVLAGLHGGCLELIGNDQVRAIRDLKGKSVAVGLPGTPPYTFLAAMLVYVGLDPSRDITPVLGPVGESARIFERVSLFDSGQVDAILIAPPGPQILRAQGIGQVVVNTAIDRPWSQYYCCMLAANREFVQRAPAATRRALRAILKATDLCASEPDRVAQYMVDKGHTAVGRNNLEYAAQGLQETPYNRWREYDADDTLRFFALRLLEAGLIRNPPDKLIAQGSDWRFLTDLKRELKG